MEISQLNGNTLVDATFHEYINTVGAVIFSFDNSFSPSALWGGSWSRVTNRFLIGSGGTYTTGGTGGETNVTITVNQIPGHSHVQKLAVFGIGQPIMVEGPQSEDGYQVASQGAKSANGTPVQTEASGGGQAHNNMPPYIGCNIWRKIA